MTIRQELLQRCQDTQIPSVWAADARSKRKGVDRRGQPTRMKFLSRLALSGCRMPIILQKRYLFHHLIILINPFPFDVLIISQFLAVVNIFFRGKGLFFSPSRKPDGAWPCAVAHSTKKSDIQCQHLPWPCVLPRKPHPVQCTYTGLRQSCELDHSCR